MRWNASLLMLPLCGALLCACGDDEVVVREQADPNADFASYKTFAFAQAQDGGTVDISGEVAGNLKLVNDAVKKQLEDRGLDEVAPDQNPDVIAFSLESTKDKAALSWSCVPGYWYGDWDFSFDPCSVISPTYNEYESGTIVVGLSDESLGRVVFGGVAEGVIEGDENDIQREIKTAVSKIFDGYPKSQTGSDAGTE